MALRRYVVIAEGLHYFDARGPEGKPTRHEGVRKGYVFWARRDFTKFGDGTRFALVPDESWDDVRKLSFIDAKAHTGISASGWDDLEQEWRAHNGGTGL